MALIKTNYRHSISCTIPNFRYHTPFLIHSTLGTLSMNKFKLALLTAAFVGLFACTTTQQPKKTVKTRYLKNNISQAEIVDCARDGISYVLKVGFVFQVFCRTKAYTIECMPW